MKKPEKELLKEHEQAMRELAETTPGTFENSQAVDKVLAIDEKLRFFRNK